MIRVKLGSHIPFIFFAGSPAPYMLRTRRTVSSSLQRDAKRLGALALALGASGSRVEDIYWENQLADQIRKLLRQQQDEALEHALDELAQSDTNAYEVLIELIETHSESGTVTGPDGQPWDALLIVAPLAAWTRYSIFSGPLTAPAHARLQQALHTDILASDARLALLPALFSMDQMPRSFSETWRWMQNLAQQAVQGSEVHLQDYLLSEQVETAPMLADTRYLVGVVAAPAGAPLFRWQEDGGRPEASRGNSLEQWIAHTHEAFSELLPGCAFECILPDAYYVSNREADKTIRPLTLQAALSWLQESMDMPAETLRAVIAGCGESRIEEYRIGLTAKQSNDVIYGCMWPLFGPEVAIQAIDDGAETVAQISELLRRSGVREIRRIPGLLAPEHCEDCGAPYFPNPQGELVHPEMPEEVPSAPALFH